MKRRRSGNSESGEPSTEARRETAEARRKIAGDSADIAGSSDFAGFSEFAEFSESTEGMESAEGSAEGAESAEGSAEGAESAKSESLKSVKSSEQSKKPKKKSNALLDVLIAISAIFMIGAICLIAYPTFSDWWNRMHQSYAVASYVEQTEDLSGEEKQHMLDAAHAYNEALAANGDRWHLTDEQKQTYENTLDITGTGIMGYVTIPRIKVKLPVYHGTSEGVLQIAAGHLAGTSLPVGGETTHAVISGHTGLPSAKLLTGLDELQKGDTFAFHVLDETYTYQVDQISVVLPSDISKLNIESGKDYATLITCTPYGVNSHRLLVRGHRIPNPKVPDATTYDEPGYMTAVAALVIGLLVSIIGFACVWLARLWRRGRIVKADRVAAGRHSSGRRA